MVFARLLGDKQRRPVGVKEILRRVGAAARGVEMRGRVECGRLLAGQVSRNPGMVSLPWLTTFPSPARVVTLTGITSFVEIVSRSSRPWSVIFGAETVHRAGVDGKEQRAVADESAL